MISDAPPIVIDLDLFGISRHSDHIRRYRERNPGLGVTVGVEGDDGGDVVASTGTYIDSYDQHAWYVLGGLRYTIGERDGLHAALAGELGFLDGSNIRGPTLFPVAEVGYDWANLGITGAPPAPGPGSSWMIALFCEIRLVTF